MHISYFIFIFFVWFKMNINKAVLGSTSKPTRGSSLRRVVTWPCVGRIVCGHQRVEVEVLFWHACFLFSSRSFIWMLVRALTCSWSHGASGILWVAASVSWCSDSLQVTGGSGQKRHQIHNVSDGPWTWTSSEQTRVVLINQSSVLQDDTQRTITDNDLWMIYTHFRHRVC